MSSNLDADTVIKTWFLIDFINESESVNKQVLWGIVVHDLKGRWIPGECCCMSLILREFEGQIFQTKNNVYLAQGEGQRLSAPAEAINLLRSGYSSDNWDTLFELKNQFPKSAKPQE